MDCKAERPKCSSRISREVFFCMRYACINLRMTGVSSVVVEHTFHLRTRETEADKGKQGIRLTRIQREILCQKLKIQKTTI